MIGTPGRVIVETDGSVIIEEWRFTVDEAEPFTLDSPAAAAALAVAIDWAVDILVRARRPEAIQSVEVVGRP